MEHLTPEEVRVLGALIEKEHTTPEYYPLSLNALTNACNQKSSRDPVVEYSESQVLSTIDLLRQKGLAAQISGPDMRVPRYRENLVAKLNLTPQETAALCVLMLRGPQTIGEVRTRSERIFSFGNLQEAEAAINGLAAREEMPLVVRLPRQPGKDARYMHLLCGAPDIEAPVQAPPQPNEKDRIAKLEAEVAQLKEEVAQITARLSEFTKQFE